MVGGYVELEVLDKFDPSSKLLVVSQRSAVAMTLLEELVVCLTGRHVVRLDAIDLAYFVHQQSVYNTIADMDNRHRHSVVL